MEKQQGHAIINCSTRTIVLSLPGKRENYRNASLLLTLDLPYKRQAMVIPDEKVYVVPIIHMLFPESKHGYWYKHAWRLTTLPEHWSGAILVYDGECD